MRTARISVYIHLASIAVCVAFSLADRGLFISPNASRWALTYFDLLLAPALLAWIVCPVITLVATYRSNARPWQFRLAVVTESILVAAQAVAILPGYQ